MDNEGKRNLQNQVHGDSTDVDLNDKNVERAEDNILQEEKKHSLNSGVTSESSADSNLDDEVFENDDFNKNLEDRTKEKESYDGAESKAVSGSSPVDGFRSMLLTASLNGRPSSREGDVGDRTSRPASANGSEPEEQEKLSDQNAMPQTEALEKEIEGESRPSTASSSSSVVVEKSEAILEDDAAEESGNVLHFQELGAEQVVYEGEIEKMVITREGFEQVEVVSQCCQTEWSWLQDWKLINWKMGNKPDWAENRANSRQGRGSIEDLLRTDPDTLENIRVKPRRKKKSLPSHSARQMSETKERRRTIGSYSGRSSARTASMQQSPQLERGSAHWQSRSKTSVTHKSSVSGISSLPQTPKGDRDMFFQTPTVEHDSSSSSDSEYDFELQQDPLLPSIGPPTILQYNKESENPPLGNEEPANLSDTSPEALLCTSVYSGSCMFCSEEILPFPTMEEVETLTPDQLYCCPKYEQFVKAELLHRGNDAAFVRDEMIDIKPHPPYGTKAARKAAKERAAERAREREMEKQKAAGSNPTNFYALTRQMKTITYSLASTKCMDEGWTVRPTSPAHSSEHEQEDPFVIEINPQQLRRHTFLERFYKDGKRFLLFLPDGSGCSYYPSGNVAVVISLTEPGKFTYIVYEDDNDFDRAHPGMLAVFEPSGYGTCYFKGGGVRMALNPFGGVVLDSQGARKKKWLWHNLKTHVHAPPFQPITFSLSRHISVRCLAQNKIVLTFNYHRCTARFNVGAKLKAITKVNPPAVRDKYEMHLAEMKQFINILIDRSQTSMRLPHYPHPDRLPLPLRLQKVKESSKKHAQNLLPLSRPNTATVTVN